MEPEKNIIVPADFASGLPQKNFLFSYSALSSLSFNKDITMENISSYFKCVKQPFYYKKEEIIEAKQALYKLSIIKDTKAIIINAKGFCYLKQQNKSIFVIPLGRTNYLLEDNSIFIQNYTIGLLKIQNKMIAYGQGSQEICNRVFNFVLTHQYGQTMYYSKTESKTTFSIVTMISPLQRPLEKAELNILSPIEFQGVTRVAILSNNSKSNIYMGDLCIKLQGMNPLRGYGELLIAKRGMSHILFLTLNAQLEQVVKWIFPDAFLLVKTLQNVVKKFHSREVGVFLRITKY